jgi:lipopolysaccharide/colanic/teichoic acid biosynthesis glycosyltransferase
VPTYAAPVPVDGTVATHPANDPPHRPELTVPLDASPSEPDPSRLLALITRIEPPRRPSRIALVGKRAMDVIGATAGLLLLGPLLVGVAALIAAIDGRPVLFTQPRAGRSGTPFRIWKFRTMEREADAQRAALRAQNEVDGGASFKMTRDPRVTRLGRILRRTSIDELPQLINVVRGEMSLVGPRPHPFDDVAGYKPWHFGRLAVKPGLTGLWQISSRADPDFDRWVELDLRYIREWSLAQDVSIVLKTIPAVVRATGR